MTRILPLAAAVVLFASGLPAAESIQLDSSENLFIVLAAANMAGYDADLTSPANSPLRRQLREYLVKQNIPVLPELRDFYKHHTQGDPVADLSEYISYALSVTGPPDFQWRTRDVEIPPDAMALGGFSSLLGQFYRQANLGEIWKRAQPAFEKEMAKYHAPLVATTTVVNSYLRVPASGYLGRRFRVYVDLLGAPNQVQTRNYGDDAFVIVTPSAEPRVFDIRHAYLHFHLDPIVIKWGLALETKKSLMDFTRGAPALGENYKNDFVLLTTECLIKAVEAKLDKNPQSVNAAARQGFILTPVLYEQLAKYEAQPQGIRFFLPDMIDAIDPGKETKRLDAIPFDKTRTASAVVKHNGPAPAETPQVSASGKTVEQAEQLYLKRSLPDSKRLYLKALEQRGSPEDHAQAWYGLARIAVLQNEPEPAIKLFEKALGASPDPQTRAWCYVYLARLSHAAKDDAAATRYYDEALKVAGASEVARAAAQSESGKIRNN